jgi:hypothetical protein
MTSHDLILRVRPLAYGSRASEIWRFMSMDEQLKLFDYEYTDLDYSEWKWVYYNERA